MKKSIFILFFALLGVFSARAYDFEVDGIYYNIISSTENQVEVTYLYENYISYSGSVAIPATVEYNGTTSTVTSIGNSAFSGCIGLTSVTIPESVTTIGAWAFEGCIGLTSVTIPESVTTIGAWAFKDCTGLTSVTIPERVTSIGFYVFYGCSGLTSVEWNAVVCQDVDHPGPFGYCENITSITFGNQVERIPAYLCYWMNKLTTVTIPNSVTSIGSSAFEGCSGLTSVTISNGVTTIGEYAFEDCSGLTSVTIPESVTTIGEYAFEDCSGLTSMTIPESVTSIGSSAFAGCSGLTSVTIPNSVNTIEVSSFYGCSGLTSVTIPESVTSIEEYAFSDCIGLTSVTIPESVTSIGEGAFEYCAGLTSVTIPRGVTSIGSAAFTNCSGLTSVEWNVVALHDFEYDDSYYNSMYPPFYNCANITSITFGKQVEHIPAYLCYEMNKLRSLTLPASVTSIGEKAFYECSGLLSITSWAKMPPICTTDDIFSTEQNPSVYPQTLSVPHGSKSLYESAREWNKFAKIEEIEANTYIVTVQPNNAAMGSVTGGGEYKEGDQAILAAIPQQGYYFERWDDGNTNNPCSLTVSGDTTITAIFAKNGDTPTPNETLEADNFHVYAQDRTIHLSESRGLVQVYNMAGQCVYNGHATAIPVPQSGVYIVAVGSQRFKVLVR